MNLYRGCEHACLYCDGRAERYYVDGVFDRDITVKRNALAVLGRELDRLPEPGFIFVGGGVSDAFQPAEARYRLARGALEMILARGLPVHILTKSALVERDLDLLQEINRKSVAILSFSINSVDEGLRERFEPGAAPLAERWRLLERGRSLGLLTGVMAMPVLPGICDSAVAIDHLVQRAGQAGASFLCFSGLTLRPGIQREGFLAVIRTHYPHLLDGYAKVYQRQIRSGSGHPAYHQRVTDRFTGAMNRHGVPGHIPRSAYHGQIPLYAELAVALDQQAGDNQLAGRPTPYLARAAADLQRWSGKRLATLNRRRGPGWPAVEQELRFIAATRGWPEIVGRNLAAVPVIERLLELG